MAVCIGTSFWANFEILCASGAFDFGIVFYKSEKESRWHNTLNRKVMTYVSCTESRGRSNRARLDYTSEHRLRVGFELKISDWGRVLARKHDPIPPLPRTISNAWHLTHSNDLKARSEAAIESLFRLSYSESLSLRVIILNTWNSLQGLKHYKFWINEQEIGVCRPLPESAPMRSLFLHRAWAIRCQSKPWLRNQELFSRGLFVA